MRGKGEARRIEQIRKSIGEMGIERRKAKQKQGGRKRRKGWRKRGRNQY